MSFIWSSAKKDVVRRLRDPVALIIWIGIPILILTLLTLAFGFGKQVKPQAHLLVVDEDESFVSTLLIGAFGRGPLAELILVEQVDSAAGHERIHAGDGSALLVIPEGFGEAVLKEEPTELKLLTNPSQFILPGIIEETLSILVDGTFYVQRIFGEPLREIVDGPPEGEDYFSDEAIASISVTINRLVEQIGDNLLPPVIELEMSLDVEEDEEAPPIAFGGLFFLGMFFMALFFMAQGMSDDVWRERAQGTLRRAVTTPHGVAGLLAGKLLAGGAIIGAISLIGLPFGSWVYELEMTRLPLAVLWSAFSGTVLLALFTLVQLYATSQRMGSILTGMVVFPLLIVGGSFFPFVAMPDFLAAIGRWTPNGWALEQLKAIVIGALDPARLAATFGGLAAVGAGAYLWSARRMRRVFARA
jgi:ABC-type Na+ efflux pump permease subunit